MEYFDEEKYKEEKAKEVFDKIVLKQAKITKKILLYLFIGIGSIFLILGLCLMSIRLELMITLLGLGAFMIFLGMVLYLAIPNKLSYERYKNRTLNLGNINYYDMLMRLELLEEKNKELKQELEDLKDKVKND